MLTCKDCYERVLFLYASYLYLICGPWHCPAGFCLCTVQNHHNLNHDLNLESLSIIKPRRIWKGKKKVWPIHKPFFKIIVLIHELSGCSKNNKTSLEGQNYN